MSCKSFFSAELTNCFAFNCSPIWVIESNSNFSHIPLRALRKPWQHISVVVTVFLRPFELVMRLQMCLVPVSWHDSTFKLNWWMNEACSATAEFPLSVGFLLSSMSSSRDVQTFGLKLHNKKNNHVKTKIDFQRRVNTSMPITLIDYFQSNNSGYCAKRSLTSHDNCKHFSAYFIHSISLSIYKLLLNNSFQFKKICDDSRDTRITRKSKLSRNSHDRCFSGSDL